MLLASVDAGSVSLKDVYIDAGPPDMMYLVAPRLFSPSFAVKMTRKDVAMWRRYFVISATFTLPLLMAHWLQVLYYRSCIESC